MASRRRLGVARLGGLGREALGEWEALGVPWRRAFSLAWEAYKAGSVPVGAVVVDADGRLLAAAHDRVYDVADGRGLAGTRLAHAEVNALAKLGPYDRHDQAVLYTSVEPCALCVGAAVAATVGTIRYASVDAYGGAAGQVAANDQTDRLPLRFDGPLPGALGLLGAVLRIEPYLRSNPDAHVVRSHRRRVPEIVSAAEELSERGDLAGIASAGGSFEDALPHLWRAVERSSAA